MFSPSEKCRSGLPDGEIDISSSSPRHGLPSEHSYVAGAEAAETLACHSPAWKIEVREEGSANLCSLIRLVPVVDVISNNRIKWNHSSASLLLLTPPVRQPSYSPSPFLTLPARRFCPPEPSPPPPLFQLFNSFCALALLRTLQIDADL